MAVNRRFVLLGGASGLVFSACATPPAVTPSTFASSAPSPAGDWRSYGGDVASTKYSPLDQVNRTNAGELKIAWEWASPDAAIITANPDLKLAPGEFQATPIMADGVLYTSTAMSQVAAIDPASGATLWLFDPQTWKHGRPTSKGFQHRGVAWWRDGDDTRIFIATGDNRLIALDARTGKPVTTFGSRGEVDLGSVGLQRKVTRDPTDVFGSTSPPIICRDTLIVGQYIHDRSVQDVMPPGDVRGFDVRTGALKWTFHVVPQAGEPGYETWAPGTAEKSGNGNVWTMMSADEEPLHSPAHESRQPARLHVPSHPTASGVQPDARARNGGDVLEKSEWPKLPLEYAPAPVRMRWRPHEVSYTKAEAPCGRRGRRSHFPSVTPRAPEQ